MTTSGNYYKSVMDEFYGWLNPYTKNLAEALKLTYLTNSELFHQIKASNQIKYTLRAKKLDDSKLSILSSNQKSKLYKYSRRVNRGDYVIDVALRDIELDPRFEELNEIKTLNAPNKWKDILTQARTAHFLGFYDAAIILSGKTLELVFKSKLKIGNVSYEEKWGINQLYGAFKKLLDKKPVSTRDELVRSTKNIIQILRNTFAHGNIDIATQEESELVWRSILFIISSTT